MALSDISILKPIVDALGDADAVLQLQLGTTPVTTVYGSGQLSMQVYGRVGVLPPVSVSGSSVTIPTVQYQLTTIRRDIDSSKAETEFDNAEIALAVARNTEKGLAAIFAPIFNNECNALNTFYSSQYGSGLRSYFAVTGATQWSDNFRTLWSRVMKTELIVHLGDITNTAGTWGAFYPDKIISLNTALEIRCTTAITASIAVSVLLTKVGGGTELAAVNIPASTAINTVFPIKGVTGKYNGISTVTAVGGEDTDVLAFWVSL